MAVEFSSTVAHAPIMAEDCANPLLLQWLKEWMDEARERNSKGYTV